MHTFCTYMFPAHIAKYILHVFKYGQGACNVYMMYMMNYYDITSYWQCKWFSGAMDTDTACNRSARVGLADAVQAV